MSFANGLELKCKIIDTDPLRGFVFDYWGNSDISLSDRKGGTDLTILD